MKPRISLVKYLNSVPLGWGLMRGPYRGEFELSLSSPAECAEQLRSARVDVGLIPAIEYQRIEGLAIVPGIAVGARRRVRSVILVGRVPIEEVRTIAIDTTSRTSVALLQVLLRSFRGIQASLIPMPPNLELMLSKADAALIIGDAALKAYGRGYIIYDLAEEWYSFTGKPFVFAFWAARSEVDLSRHLARFEESKRFGLQNIPEIAAVYAPQLGLTEAEIRSYLTDCVDYDLGPESLEGLGLFFQLAYQLELIERPRELRFIGSS